MDSDIKFTGKNLFNFKYIGIALIFLIDFNVNNIDFLPDLIAVVLISAGIGSVCYVNENFAAAKKYIKVFYAVALVKIAFNIIYFIFGDQPIFIDGVISINVVFVVELLELILCVLIYKKIFKGIEDYYYASESTLKSDTFAVVPKILNVFFTAKFVLHIIPQIPALFSASDFDALSTLFETWVDSGFLTKYLLSPCVIIQTLLGVFMLSVALPFFWESAKDGKLCGLIKSKINSLLINDIFFILKRTLRTAFAFFAAGCVFFIDLQFDNINILPDFMICVLFIIGVYLVKSMDSDINDIKEIKNKKLTLYLVINLFVSAASYIVRAIYKAKMLHIFSDEITTGTYILRIISDVLYHSSIIIFLLIFIEFYIFIKKLQQKHLDFSVIYLNKYLTLSEKNIDKHRDNIFIIAAAVFAVKSLSVLLPQDISSGWIIFIHSLVLIIFIVFVIRGLYKIRDSIYSYYEL